MNKIYDAVVIGGGVVGVSIFNKLVRIGKKVALIDSASDVATGASKANSGLVHAGYDPEPNTLKAKLNVEGANLYPKICRRLSIPLRKCGALVVGDDLEKIQNLYERGQKNGVKELYILNRQELLKIVPDLREHITVGLYAKTAALVSPYLFTIALCEEGIINGGELYLEEDLVECRKEKDIFEIVTKNNTFKTKSIINSAGFGYNEVAKILGTEEYPLEYRRGEYFVFSKESTLNVPCTIFPLPTEKGKGVLITPTIDGNYLVGPTSEKSEYETVTTESGLKEIKEKAGLILNKVDFKNAIREFSGVRTICGDDFIIEKSKVNGIINIAGICSPGLSSAPAIANMVVKLLGFKTSELENLKKIEPYKMLKDYPIKTQNEMVKENKDYGEVVCKCEKITKGDIVAVLKRPIKIRSVDAVKRRTNAGMGLCQGGFCFTKVVNIIAKTRKISYEDVLKENRGSEVSVGDIREVNYGN